MNAIKAITTTDGLTFQAEGATVITYHPTLNGEGRFHVDTREHRGACHYGVVSRTVVPEKFVTSIHCVPSGDRDFIEEA